MGEYAASSEGGTIFDAVQDLVEGTVSFVVFMIEERACLYKDGKE